MLDAGFFWDAESELSLPYRIVERFELSQHVPDLDAFNRTIDELRGEYVWTD